MTKLHNSEIARIFFEIANILEMQNVQWKPQAYRRAAKAIEVLSEDVEDIYKTKGIKGLEEIPGVGEKLAKKIIEYLETGKVKEYERLKKATEAKVSELMEIPGIGPKKIKKLYQLLKIKTLKDLEKAAKQHKIAKLPGFGIVSEENILKSLELKKGKRYLLSDALFVAEHVVSELKKLKSVEKISVAGSLRRMKETIRDIDILVTSSKPLEVINAFISLSNVDRILAKGPTKSTVILKNGMQADVRVIAKESFGSALQYFTGSKEHNISLRTIALKKGYKLSEYGLFRRNGKRIAGANEEEIYNKLGMVYIEPELRENRGEIEAALQNKLPKLIDYKDIRGDFHVHTKWSDGNDTIERMALTAKALGYEYICISDHSKSQHIAHGLDEERLLQQIEEIKKLNKKFSKQNFRILTGAEVDILASGELDFPDDILKKLDIVIASIHSGFKQSKEIMTKRIIKALENKQVDIFGHPTGRIINEREPYLIDLEALFEFAAERKIILEINAFPDRLDLNDTGIKEALNYGIKFAIGTDAHNSDQLNLMKFGVATARRGWAEKKDIANSFSLKELPKFFKKIKI